MLRFFARTPEGALRPPLVLPTSFAAALALASCASGKPAPDAPLRYPELPKPDASSGASRFVPDASLQRTQLACQGTEIPENGIDDDCDGVIDSALPHATDLTIVVAYRAEAAGEVQLDLTAETGAPIPNLGVNGATSRGPAVNLSRLDLSGLSAGRYRVSAARAGAEREQAALSLAVSLATGGAVDTYLVRLGAGEKRTLGAIEVAEAH